MKSFFSCFVRRLNTSSCHSDLCYMETVFYGLWAVTVNTKYDILSKKIKPNITLCHLKNVTSLWFRDKTLRKKNLEDNGAKRNSECTFVETKKQYWALITADISWGACISHLLFLKKKNTSSTSKSVTEKYRKKFWNNFWIHDEFI